MLTAKHDTRDKTTKSWLDKQFGEWCMFWTDQVSVLYAGASGFGENNDFVAFEV